MAEKTKMLQTKCNFYEKIQIKSLNINTKIYQLRLFYVHFKHCKFYIAFVIKTLLSLCIYTVSQKKFPPLNSCLLYTSDAADE